MWTQSDRRYLRSLRIASTDPPEPLPRFQVEPTENEGEYRVTDRLRGYVETHIIAPHFDDSPGMAEAIARELNEKHQRLA